ncbi:hypothetical protein ACQ4M3_40595 [Leptolyngbya sp. AN03gr2]|uniref:hypothetical protein n=1 Tax=unclassified Leptolyngbya TaxID=2650499 RepID=UPI003D311153
MHWLRISWAHHTPDQSITLIGQTYCRDSAEMLRIQAVEIRSLHHPRVRTRWCSSPAPNCFLGITSETTDCPTSHADVPDTVGASLAASIQLRQQKGSILAAQLTDPKQQGGGELPSVRQQEIIDFTAQQTQLLEHLCPHLAIDARTLSTTPEFRQFVRSVFVPAEVGIITRPLQILQNPIDWALNTLPHPLQLHQIETLQRCQNPESPAFVVKLQASLGGWSQTISVPIDEQQDGLLPSYQATYTTWQWVEVAVQLEPHLTQLPIASFHQLGLAQELVCLLTYIGELFNTTARVDRFDPSLL